MPFMAIPGEAHFQMFFEEAASSAPTPTIYIHGNLGSNHWWYPAIRQMQDQGRGKFQATSYLVEFRGCGRSEFKLRPNEKYPLDKVVEDLKYFLQEKKLTDVNLVGHSTGGFLAMRLAAIVPQLIRKLFLVDPVGPLGLQFDEEIFSVYEEMKTNLALVEKVIRKTVLHKKQIDEKLWDDICHWVQVAVGRLGAAIPESLRGVDYTQQFRQILTPTFILHGNDDRLIHMSTSEDLKLLLPHSELRILPRIGHSPNIEDPTVFAYILSEWLQK